MSSSPDFVYVTYIDTTPEALWEALTNDAFTAKYWGGCRLKSDWQEGSELVSTDEDGKLDFTGTILVSEPFSRLVYTFDVPGSDETPSRVSFEITEFQGKQKLTVEHDQFAEGSEIHRKITIGWPPILSGLKSLLETGQTLLPDWR